ncbi:FAD-linked oxidoreductase [Psilocybe cubensis]|uniref:FAD-linked oxidoreductase n=2 Tax=Psilocybe cubensis TaxID=181762 RepID=A0ACB8H9Z5_PSICU|nr:FAD-linked oxidoreductase [Psilocybe cubensis]KAH9484487.1 FAD-linked oxidoreductase [Psilocybe cubensis]
MLELEKLSAALIVFSLLHGVRGDDEVSLASPNHMDWASLNRTVNGRLAVGIPWTEPCFTIYNGKNVTQNFAQCGFVQANFFDHPARSNAFGAYTLQNYEECMATGDQCALDWMNPANPLAFNPPQTCNQGSIPDYFIDVQNENDVVAALNFVSKNNIPLVIKNTGHDFKGRSSAPGSLALWMHNLKNMTHESNFVPEGCHTSSQEALTLAAGTQWQEVYEFANSLGLEVVGGAEQSVGAVGGWVQGGGHSSLTPMFGMGADRVLQYKAVTPDGILRTVNSCQNSDLFFALRGGGGGTFAVVLEATVMASPSQAFRVANINWPVTDDNLKKVLSIVVDNAISIASAGWGGYLTPTLGNLVLMSNKFSSSDAEKMFQPLISLTTQMGGVSNVTEFPNYLEWFNAYSNGQSGSQDGVAVPNALTSRLIPAKNHETAAGRAEILDALTNAFANAEFSQLHFTTPFGFKGSDGKDTSVNPIWRSSLYQIILVNPWVYNATVDVKRATYAQGTKAVNFLRDVTPDSGAYLNESDIHEPNHEVSFWGINYARLLQIKNKYDPRRILDCWHCVGWEGPTSPRFKCYI